MIAATYYCLIAIAAVVALVDWRRAMLLCLVLDVLRDPVRKLVVGHPVLITLAVGLLWCAIFAGMYLSERDRGMTRFVRLYPRSRAAFALLLLGLLPAALLSLTSYARGWLLVMAGGASYAFPFLAVLIGFTFAKRERDILVFLGVYVLLNTAALSGAVLEFMDAAIPALGGVDAIWIRHRHGYMIELMSGFYRSPDLLGLHAAHVAMFGSIFAIRKESRFRPLWVLVVCFAGACLLLSGRRKMIVMPAVFAIVLFYGLARRHHVSKAFQSAVLLVLIAAATWALLPSDAADHLTYARTSAEEGFHRVNAVPRVVTTFRQAGPLGYGLGTATQGAYHLARHGQRTWQEDGIGRLAAELGIPGLILVFAAVWMGFREVISALRRSTQKKGLVLQYGLLAVFGANLASFIVSHQAYSGDLSSIAIACLCLGFVMAMPHFEVRGSCKQVVKAGQRRPVAVPCWFPARHTPDNYYAWRDDNRIRTSCQMPAGQ